MAATVDDLLRIAGDLRSDVQFVAHSVYQVEQAIKAKSVSGGGGKSTPGAGGVSNPPTPPPSPFGAALDKFVGQAAKGALALTAFTVLFDKLISGLGAGLARFVSLANPAVVQRFNLALDNAASAMGRILIPVMERFTQILQQVGNAIESLSPQAKELIGALAAGGGLAAAFGAIAVGATLLVRVLGSWVTILTVVAGAFAGVLTTTASGKELLAGFGTILKQVGTIFEIIAKTLIPIAASVAGPVLKTIGEVLGALGGYVGKIMMALAPGLKAVGDLFAAIVPVLGELMRAFIPLMEAAMVPLAALISIVARVISAVLVPVLDQLAMTIRSVVDFIVAAVNRLLKLLGLNQLEGAPEYDPNKKSAQAVRQSSITDLRGFANKAYTSAFGGAASTDIPAATLKEAEKHTSRLDTIISLLGSGYGKDRGKLAAGAAKDVVTDGGGIGAGVGAGIGAAALPLAPKTGAKIGEYIGSIYDRMRKILN